VLARLFSPPLSEIVMPVLRDSSNWTAEMLVLHVGLARTGEGRYDDGVEALGAFLTAEVGIAEDLFAIDDVSGLSPENLLSPQAVVSLLRFVWRQPWRDAFLAAMARPGSGTLAAWPALPPQAAKTGTLKHTLALAGMLGADAAAAASASGALGVLPGAAAELGSGAPEPIFFAVFLNHDLRDRGAQRQEIADLLRSWRRLAGASS
jgi:D-alanyl-D-alanine carboxypeptidase/D-alanyl-D-alanine-endopeptidase (penicillin-binding protein 4)